MGKSPLRLVAQRVPQFTCSDTQPKYWIETLECGHSVPAYINVQDAAGFSAIPFAKRRRCVECKEEISPTVSALPLPPEKISRVCKFSRRVVDRLFAAKYSHPDPWMRDDLHVAAVTVIYAAKGYGSPWDRAFLEYYGKHFHKVLPYWLEQAATRSMLGPGLKADDLIYPPKKKPQSVREIPGEKAREL